MSRQVRSDGRIQAALLEAFKRDIPFAKLASYVSRRNLRCCNLKALETILEAWTRKMEAEFSAGNSLRGRITYANGDGEATVDAVDKLLQVFITIRRKQSPIWRKEQEGLKQTAKAIDSLERNAEAFGTRMTEREAAKLDELNRLLKPTGDAAVSTRRPGMATPEEELRKWPHNRLTSEIRKQIRRDFGGRSEDWVLAWIITELKGKTLREQAVWVLDLLGKQVKGSRDRIESKLKELERRGDGLSGSWLK